MPCQPPDPTETPKKTKKLLTSLADSMAYFQAKIISDHAVCVWRKFILSERKGKS